MRHSRSGHLFLTKLLPDRRALRQSQNSRLEPLTSADVVVLPHLVHMWWRQRPGHPPMRAHSPPQTFPVLSDLALSDLAAGRLLRVLAIKPVLGSLPPLARAPTRCRWSG